MKYLVIFFLLICSFALKSQEGFEEDTNIIFWRNKVKLSWNDFLGKPPESFKTLYNTEADAVSNINIEYQFIELKDGVKYKVYCFFVKDKSWTKDNSKPTILSHEQLHFDIGELHARKIRLAFETLKEKHIYSEESYATVFDSLFQDFIQVNRTYDKETLLGSLANIQEQWNEKVYKELKIFEEYHVEY